MSELIATLKEGDSLGVKGHKRLVQLNVPEDEIAQWLAAWKPSIARYTRSVLAKYGCVGLCQRDYRLKGSRLSRHGCGAGARRNNAGIIWKNARGKPGCFRFLVCRL